MVTLLWSLGTVENASFWPISVRGIIVIKSYKPFTSTLKFLWFGMCVWWNSCQAKTLPLSYILTLEFILVCFQIHNKMGCSPSWRSSLQCLIGVSPPLHLALLYKLLLKLSMSRDSVLSRRQEPRDFHNFM